MEIKRIGIGDIGIYIPEPVISIERLVRERPLVPEKIQKSILRASEKTGQMAIRFPKFWEDTATLAAQSAKNCLDRHTHLDYSKIRYIAVGTETTVDHSKPAAAYVQGMLQKADFPIPGNISTFQVQHACAGGTLGLLSVSALLSHSPVETESGIVICSDIARYKTESTAEVTQGAGAISLLVEQKPDLIELDLETQGYSAQDVDDFFRPLGSMTAKVKGRFSILCFEEALKEAFEDHCWRRKKTPADVLNQTDFFVLHTPFHNMPIKAMRYLLDQYLSYNESQADQFIDDHGILASVAPSAFIGNLYSGAMYLSLAALLKNRYELMGDKIVGKNILMASYGSGNIMIVLSGKIAPGAPKVIESWNFDNIALSAENAELSVYEDWVNRKEPEAGTLFVPDPELVKPGHFYLKDLRDDGYREYEYKK